jgi:hypothetical protein
MTDARVELDTRALEAGLGQLLRGINLDKGQVCFQAANIVAARLRDVVPVRTGRLISTIRVSKIPFGAQTHYGGNLRYDDYIDRRVGATDKATQGVTALFMGMATAMTARQVNRL